MSEHSTGATIPDDVMERAVAGYGILWAVSIVGSFLIGGV